MTKHIFRKASLERLSSPEQLDQLMQVTRPLSWLSLIASFVLLGVAVFWGFRAEIPTEVHGQGILLKKGSIYDLVSLGTGQVKQLAVEVDDIVSKGQVLATLSQPDLDHEIKDAKNSLMSLEAEQKLILSLGEETSDLKRKYIAKQRLTLQEAIRFSEKRLKFLKSQVGHEKRLLEKGISTPSQYEDAKNTYEKALEQVMNYKSELNNLSAKEVDIMSTKEKDLIEIKHRVTQAKAKIKALESNLLLYSEIVSPHQGRILEIFKDRGQVIRTGEPILSIEIIYREKEPLDAILYFSPLAGKKIHVGMRAHVSPSIVKQEEYGYMIGEVNQVSVFPASQKGMFRVLQNEDLVKRLSMGGAPIMVSTGLILDPGTTSGYKWSSGLGPPLEIQSGTICSASVVVYKQTPASLVLPYLKRHILGIGEEHVEKQE